MCFASETRTLGHSDTFVPYNPLALGKGVFAAIPQFRNSGFAHDDFVLLGFGFWGMSTVLALPLFFVSALWGRFGRGVGGGFFLCSKLNQTKAVLFLGRLFLGGGRRGGEEEGGGCTKGGEGRSAEI